MEILKLREKLKEEEDLLALMEKEINGKIPPSRAKQWDEISPKIIVVLQDVLSTGKDDEDIPESAQTKAADNIRHISRCLENEDYLEAYHLLRFTEKVSEANKDR